MLIASAALNDWDAYFLANQAHDALRHVVREAQWDSSYALHPGAEWMRDKMKDKKLPPGPFSVLGTYGNVLVGTFLFAVFVELVNRVRARFPGTSEDHAPAPKPAEQPQGVPQVSGDVFDELHEDLLEKCKIYDNGVPHDGEQGITESDAASWSTYITNMRSRFDAARQAGEISEYKVSVLLSVLDQLSERIKGGPRPK